MKLTPLYDLDKGQMKVLALMSGSGTNIDKILRYERGMKDCPFRIIGIFSDNSRSNAEKIG